jgi:hypothetical protein
MGHYRSEMGFDEEDRKKAEREQQRFDRIKANIDADITKNGIAHVLARIVTSSDYEMYAARRHYDWNIDEFKERL